MAVTPESRRDAAIAEIIAAGGSILSVVPLAKSVTPHTVHAYRVASGAPTLDVLTALAVVQEDTERDIADLIDWTPEPEPEIPPEPIVEDLNPLEA